MSTQNRPQILYFRLICEILPILFMMNNSYKTSHNKEVIHTALVKFKIFSYGAISSGDRWDS